MTHSSTPEGMGLCIHSVYCMYVCSIYVQMYSICTSVVRMYPVQIQVGIQHTYVPSLSIIVIGSLLKSDSCTFSAVSESISTTRSNFSDPSQR